MTANHMHELLARQARVWSQICFMTEGLAIAPAVHSLIRHGMIDKLKAAPTAAALLGLGGNAGFVAVAVRALVQQGRLSNNGGVPDGALAVENRIWLQQASDYSQVPGLLDVCGKLMGNEVPGGNRENAGEALRRWLFGIPVDAIPDRVTTELLGFLAAPVLLGLVDAGSIPPFQPAPCPLEDAKPTDPAGVLGYMALRCLGWIDGPATAPALTIEGRMASVFAGQLRYPLSYLPMLARMDDLLFGDPRAATRRADDGTESHLDRAADIRFSTEVFARSCAPALLAIALPLFHRDRGPGRPAVIVDVGCGEANLLATLFDAIRDNPDTADAASDLVLVGVENNPVAERAARQTLTKSGAKFVVIGGDVSRPDAIARDLAAQGIDFTNVLHVNKSVIHDRELVDDRLGTAGLAQADFANLTDGAFARPDGTRVDAETVQDDLVRFFQRWRPYLARHGMIALEPHGLTTTLAPMLAGRSLTAAMEALHGFSCQYLTTAEHFACAAARSGLTIFQQRMIGSSLTGHDHMSCSHLGAHPAS